MCIADGDIDGLMILIMWLILGNNRDGIRGMDNMIPIDIVITTWGREWMTKACLEALACNTRTPYRLIVIDNGSTKEAQQLYSNVAGVYTRFSCNRGLEYAKHTAMEFVESEYFISMDNDILVYAYEDKDWLQRLINLQYKHR